MAKFTIKIDAAEKIIVQDSGEHLLSVLFKIANEGDEVAVMRHGFPLDTTVEQLEAQARVILATFISDTENSARNAEIDQRNETADDTIAEIVGREITQ